MAATSGGSSAQPPRPQRAHRPGLQAPPGAGAGVGGAGAARGSISAGRVGASAQRPASCAEEAAAAPKGRSGLRLAARGLAPGVPKGAPRPGFRSVRPRGEKVTGPDSAETVEGGVFSAVWVWSPTSPAAAGGQGQALTGRDELAAYGKKPVA